MTRVGIIADSHSSITQEMAEKMGIQVIPAPFYIDGKQYLEDVSLTREEFFRLQEEGHDIKTTQPNIAEVAQEWGKALLEYDQILYFPISAGLSGSCQTAELVSHDDAFEGRVFVVNNGRVSTPMDVTIRDALTMINKGYDAPTIQKKLQDSRDDEIIYLAVETLQYLKSGGRITAGAAKLAGLLNIKPILKMTTGNIDMFKVCRSMKRARKMMIEQIRSDMDTKFRKWKEAGELYLMTSGSVMGKEKEGWIEQVKEAFPGWNVISDDLSLGVCVHTGPGVCAIGIARKVTE